MAARSALRAGSMSAATMDGAALEALTSLDERHENRTSKSAADAATTFVLTRSLPLAGRSAANCASSPQDLPRLTRRTVTMTTGPSLSDLDAGDAACTVASGAS